MIEALTYIVALFGIMRAGFTVFLISHRISPTTLEHLIKTSRLTHILMSQDDLQLVSTVQSAAKNVDVPFTTSFIPTFNELFLGESVRAPPAETPELDENDIIMHSSGTSFLRPHMFLTNHFFYRIYCAS